MDKNRDLKAMNTIDVSMSDFLYDLPEEKIAKFPLADRDASKLLVYRGGEISSSHFRDLGDFLPDNTILVFNNSRVVHARLLFHNETGARIEVFCLEPPEGVTIEQGLAALGKVDWLCMIGNAKRWKDGPLRLVSGFDNQHVVLTVERVESSGTESLLRFKWDQPSLSFSQVLEHFGKLPLPPYLKREADKDDENRYNTVYARNEGSVAAPTAGLHFTTGLLGKLQEKGVRMEYLTLHVGAGTFLPVKSGSISGHKMHSERIYVEHKVISDLISGLKSGHITAVGTTSLRTLESLYWFGCRLLKEGFNLNEINVPQWYPYQAHEEECPGSAESLQAILDWLDSRNERIAEGSTELIITPGYKFRIADSLITNFHQPSSTLLLLIAAFTDNNWKKIYDYALNNDYRFLSFGDSSLLFRKR